MTTTEKDIFLRHTTQPRSDKTRGLWTLPVWQKAQQYLRNQSCHFGNWSSINFSFDQQTLKLIPDLWRLLFLYYSLISDSNWITDNFPCMKSKECWVFSINTCPLFLIFFIIWPNIYLIPMLMYPLPFWIFCMGSFPWKIAPYSLIPRIQMSTNTSW